jgi:hypothetical protein
MARSHGFLDPISVLSKVRNFSQPSEVHEPIELLRSGVILHARGLMNSRAIQQNLDWIWPWWVERQFNPNDPAFVPRAFSLTHINLTHRNWTAVGIPDVEAFPIVGPGGGVVPITDGWTVEGWIMNDSGKILAPSKLDRVEQDLRYDDNLAIETLARTSGAELFSRVKMVISDDDVLCSAEYRGWSSEPGWLVLSLRPYNPEGVSFVNKIALDRGTKHRWNIDGQPLVEFGSKVDFHAVSDYHAGDVSIGLEKRRQKDHVNCDVGMATAAAMFRLDPEGKRAISVKLALNGRGEGPVENPGWNDAEEAWATSLKGLCNLEIPDNHIKFLYEGALRSLVLHSPGDVYPGPYTYKRFWFRDSTFIINAMLAANMIERSRRCLLKFPSRQNPFGFFHSQEGEWDSNGEALWIMNRFCEVTNESPPSSWINAADKGAKWILRKRISLDKDSSYAGLLPAGFSAEHLGSNDYYYWDNFWSVAGLHAASSLLSHSEEIEDHEKYDREAEEYQKVIEKYLKKNEKRLGRPAMPAAPERRLDSGAIGSIVAGYPLQLWSWNDRRLLDTVNWMMENSFVRGGFFQDMVHSGINAYLTLHIAQVLLRAKDPRACELVENIAEMASPTGQWPEAIHPRTGGGCMGDGQHVWAAAEWVMMIRNCFVLEESEDESLVLGSGIPEKLLREEETLKFGPTPTPWGNISVKIVPDKRGVHVFWEAEWFRNKPRIRIGIQGCRSVYAEPERNHMWIKRERE